MYGLAAFIGELNAIFSTWRHYDVITCSPDDSFLDTSTGSTSAGDLHKAETLGTDDQVVIGRSYQMTTHAAAFQRLHRSASLWHSQAEGCTTVGAARGLCSRVVVP